VINRANRRIVMQKKNVNWVTVVLAVVACGVVASSGLALASGTGTRGVTRVEESTVRVADDIQIKQKGGSQVIVAHITVQPGGHTPWHYHPGPHIVTVKTGTVEIYETDCGPPKSYPAGTGFFDPGGTQRLHIHTLRNPSNEAIAEVVITDIRDGDLRPTVVADPQPAPCFS
jgi:quercetin dioxygenase-like cupin family protein